MLNKNRIKASIFPYGMMAAYLSCLLIAFSWAQNTHAQQPIVAANSVKKIPQFNEKIALPLSASVAAASDKSTDNDVTDKEKSPLSLLGSAYQNGIPLLQNRFRIDFTVDELTMIFFREFGSAPIVLVQPDGTKIFQSQADGDNLFWFDAATYDMISIKKPTPGPWQAVGQISPGSRVMVISDLALHADPLPRIIFSGEILKQTSYLTNHGKPIDYSAFRDVVELRIDFVSTNNPNYNNFGSESQTIATFEDNGKGMDERPLDGTFTGQFNLAVADGEWMPVFSVSTPMFSREQVDPNLMLYPNPIKISVDIDEGGKGFHKILIDAERQHVDMSTLLLDGKVRFPSGDIQNFSITDMSSAVREHLIVNYETGVYRVKLTAYGNTVDGREFILDVPEYSFLTEEPKPITTSPVIDGANPSVTGSELDTANIVTTDPETVTPPVSADLIAEPNLDQSIMTEPESSMSKTTMVLIVVLLNLFIIGFGGAAIWYFLRKKALK
ncbi:TIGR03503 family protein [Paraglaciecola hydrolytica]|uniref:TIGR03503 family protein n=1 Tax=Paraglaciecola hydrolytica TaxID=1799789 RepID=UPI000AA63E1D|nr:TIGR03503 family protein [Paraglaciecola hydrolytica]